MLQHQHLGLVHQAHQVRRVPQVHQAMLTMQLQDVLNKPTEPASNAPTDSTAGMEPAEPSATFARAGITTEDVLNAMVDTNSQETTALPQR